MSDKIYLQDITLPIVETGTNKTYSFVQTDSDLDTAGDAADAKAVGDELTNLKQDLQEFPNGNYPNMGAGYASQLVSSLRKSDSVPYNFRKVPYDSTLEDGNIVGVSVAWNQLAHNYTSRSTTLGITIDANNTNGTIHVSGTATATNDLYFQAPLSIVAGHKYYLRGAKSGSSTHGIKIPGYAEDNGNGAIINVTTSLSTATLVYFFTSGDVIDVTIYPQLFDLTLMLGTAIADYVYGLEQSTAGSGVTWLKHHFPKIFDSGYIPYNAGEMQSVSGLSAHRMTGFNQWDEQWEAGYYGANGLPVSNYTTIRSKNYIRVIPNTEYYYKAPNGTNYRICYFDANKNFIYRSDLFVTDTTFTTPSNCHFIMFHNDGTTYNHDICINISKTTGTPKNGDYVPYEEHSYALDSTKTFRGILKLDGNDKLYADGDRYLAEGTVDRKYAEVDLGSLDWSRGASVDGAGYYYFNSDGVRTLIKKDYTNIIGICSKYSWHGWSGRTLGNICINGDGYLYVYPTDYQSADATTFKAAMNGVKLVYTLATATTETASPYGNPQVINPDGTESYVYESGAFELPVGHESEYPVNVSGQLDDILDTPTTNGTYILQATVTDGAVSYEWVSTT